MNVAPVQAAEPERLNMVVEYPTADVKAEFDFITTLAAKLCNKPVSLLGYPDGGSQWIKSVHGIDIAEIASADLLSMQTLNAPDGVTVIADLSVNEQFFGNPFRMGGGPILFYAGTPIVAASGNVLGVLCVLDYEAGTITAEQEETLVSLAKQAACLVELRKKSGQLMEARADLKRAYADLERIARIASHDLRSPLNNIISLANLIKEELGGAIGADGAEYLDFINEAAYGLADLVSSIQSYSSASGMAEELYSKVDIAELLKEVISLVKVPENFDIIYNIVSKEILAPNTVLKEVLLLLLNNSVQYNDKERGIVAITVSEHESSWLFQIADAGEGIAPADSEKIFELFRRLRGRARNAENMGIGLAIVRRLVEKMHGSISVKSEIGKGATFSFSVPKQGNSL